MNNGHMFMRVVSSWHLLILLPLPLPLPHHPSPSTIPNHSTIKLQKFSISHLSPPISQPSPPSPVALPLTKHTVSLKLNRPNEARAAGIVRVEIVVVRLRNGKGKGGDRESEWVGEEF